MAGKPVYGTFRRRRPDSDVEAAFHLSNNSAAKDSSSSARELIKLSDQANVRRKRVTKKSSNKPLDRREADFFEKFQRKWENPQYPYCLFLCYDKGNRDQRTVPVLVQDPEDEKRIYIDLSRTWYEKYGWWSRYVPFYGSISLDEVEFRFLREQDNDYSVIIQELDLFKVKEELKLGLEIAEGVVGRTEDPSYPIPCYEDADDGHWIHENPKCLAPSGALTCGYQKRQDCERRLDRLELRSLLLLCFEDPGKAVEQRTLEGMANGGCIYRVSEIGNYQFHRSRVAERTFRGLVIRTGWKLKRLDTSTAALMIVMLWKVTGGNWEAAFAAGAFYIMLVNLSRWFGSRHDACIDSCQTSAALRSFSPAQSASTTLRA